MAHLLTLREARKLNTKVPWMVAVSGGFDPLHRGHIEYFHRAKLLAGTNGKLVAILNKDGFLLRKKGYTALPYEDRLTVLSAIKFVDYIFPWDDGSQTVDGALKILLPDIFAKGGDRFLTNIPEEKTCIDLGIIMCFGLGKKVQNSSSIAHSPLTKPSK